MVLYSLPMSSALSEVERRCRELAESPFLSWEWDDRFETALAVVKKDQFQAAEGALIASLGARWTASDAIPDDVSAIASSLGGLRSGQLFFATEAGGDPILYCAWWPWGGNAQASLRVGCWSSATGDLADSVRKWFAL
jgi:hypothetical protein